MAITYYEFYGDWLRVSAFFSREVKTLEISSLVWNGIRF